MVVELMSATFRHQVRLFETLLKQGVVFAQYETAMFFLLRQLTYNLLDEAMSVVFPDRLESNT